MNNPIADRSSEPARDAEASPSEARAACPAEESIVDYCTNEAKGKARARIADHLGGCLFCRAEVEALTAALKSKLGLSCDELPPFRGG